jgi:PTH1 family peptidyl-tRNA hydrolase
MRVIVGLGNPGPEYEGTRHNSGVFFLRAAAAQIGAKELTSLKGVAEVFVHGSGKKRAYFIFPGTFMNNSGAALKKALEKLKVKVRPEEVLVLHDDLDIELGRVKMSFGRSSAGHKGVESVRKMLKTDKFWRLRIGIAPKRKPDHKKMMHFIVGKFSPAEKKSVLKNKKKILEAVELWRENPHKAMSILNAK